MSNTPTHAKFTEAVVRTYREANFSHAVNQETIDTIRVSDPKLASLIVEQQAATRNVGKYIEERFEITLTGAFTKDVVTK